MPTCFCTPGPISQGHSGIQSIWHSHWAFKFSLNFFMPKAELQILSHFFLSLFILMLKYVSIFKYLANHYLLRRYWEPGNVLVSKNTLMSGTDTNITCPQSIPSIFHHKHHILSPFQTDTCTWKLNTLFHSSHFTPQEFGTVVNNIIELDRGWQLLIYFWHEY